MKIDVAMLDCQVAILENALSRYFLTGRSPGPLGARHASIAPFGAFATADGYIIIAVGTDAMYCQLAQALDLPALTDDPRLAANAGRAEHLEELTATLEARLRTRPSKHWLAVLDAAGIPAGPINDIAAVAADAQVQARNMIVDIDDPAVAPLKLAGNPIKLSAFPDPSRRAAAPALDADRTRIVRELDHS